MPALLGAAVNVDTGEGARGAPVVAYSFESTEDLDYDELPDDWVRRKGPMFPKYVRIGIDCATGSAGMQSLRIDANCGGAILYSPLTRIDALHTYSFRGKIRTNDLWKDAAAISVSLLNYRRQRIQRYLTPVVHGNHDDWVDVEIPAMTPLPDVRFVVIGCHLLSGEEASISGTAWFDELSFCRSPGMTLDGDYVSHFRNEDSPVKVTARVSGLDAGHDYALQLEFLNADGKLLEQRRDELPADDPSGLKPDGSPIEALPIKWDLPKQEPGYYRLSATLIRDGRPHLREATSLALMRLVDKQRVRGEFGWSLDSPSAHVKPEILAEIAAQAGINRIKCPVWSSVRLDDPHSTGELAKFFEQLASKQIQTIGLLSDPPDALRVKFARNWLGVSEIFSTQTSVWGPSVEPVVARFCSTIRNWQLGDESDSSFEGLAHLEETLARTQTEINRIGLSGQIGVPWMHRADRPLAAPRSLGFISLRAEDPQNLAAMTAVWKQMGDGHPACWVLLEPTRITGDPAHRANQLARQMVAAKAAGVEAIFVNDIFADGNGLLNRDGSPSDLFLPWRTTALALQDTEYLGEIQFPQGSRNAVFVRDNEEKEKEVIIIIWRDKPSEATEMFYLGENVVEMDLWGRTMPLPVSPETRLQAIEVTAMPKILRGCSEPIARWRLATRFAAGNIRSEYGSHEDAVIGQNTFSLGISGKVTLETPQREHQARTSASLPDDDSNWQAEPREWTITAASHEPFNLPVFLTLPTDANIGDTQMKLTFTITADRPYRFDVLCPYQVGSKDVTLRVIDRKLPDGRLEIEQIVTNSTSPTEMLDFRCSLMVPGERRQKVLVTKLGAGVDRKFYYLSQADNFRGKDLRLKLEQEGGGRILNQKWTVGSDWE
jgi:hypothetical protein